MRRNKTIIMSIMCVAILFMTIGYAFLSTKLNISGSSSITSTWDIEFSRIETIETKGGATNKISPSVNGTSANFEVDLVLPGDEITYEIDITNYGDIEAEIQSASYYVSGSEAIYVYIDGIKKGSLLDGCEGLDVCPTTTFTLKVGYDENTTSDPEEKTKDIQITINVGQYVESNPTPSGDLIPELKDTSNIIYLSNKILEDNNNGFSDKENSTYVNNSTPGINFGAISSDTNGKGLYYTSTNTENNGTTYYFRGNVDNNFVQFGKYRKGTTVDGIYYDVDTSIYWRIIRINEDGSIRLIYNGTSTDATQYDLFIGYSKYNEFGDDNAYVGYMYGLTNQSGENAYKLTHANTYSSTIKEYIDKWYTDNTNLPRLKNEYLADAGFCNDRSLYDGPGTALNTTDYGAIGRLYYDLSPQFFCQNANNDLFTIGTRGNGALDYPIGLITADEMVYAGSTSGYLNTDYPYWSMTPSFFDGLSLVYTPALSWNVTMEEVSYEFGVRPVINLQSTVELSSDLPSGCTELNGTASCPYIIK